MRRNENMLKILFVCHGSILKSPGKASKINGFVKQKGAYYTTIIPFWLWDRALIWRKMEGWSEKVNATLRRQKRLLHLLMQNLWFCDRSGIFLAVRSLFTCRIFFFCYNSWCRHLLFAHDEKKWNWMKIFSVRLNSTSVLDHAQKRMPRSTWYYFFKR